MSSSLESKISDLQARLRAENGSFSGDPNSIEANPFAGSRPGSGRRPKLLPVDGTLTPTRTRKLLDLPGPNYPQPPINNIPNSSLLEQKKEILKKTGIITIDGIEYKTNIEDLEFIGELGNGTCGHVVKMLHKPSQKIIAVKQMRRSGNAEENKRIAMDLEVVLMSHDCDYIVHSLGCFVTDSDVWICMEIMGSCFDKLIKSYVTSVPEPILGKVTLATVKALHYLKEKHGVMHRDVKPSNILIDERGNVKLCDFGISGRLVDSKAKSMNAGCAAYMSPERINPADPNKPDYDIRADIWSLGITLVELATGAFPYPDCKSDFEVLTRVMDDDPPSLPDNGQFSQEFIHFVQLCLAKDYRQRPKYKKLLEHPFIKRYDVEHVDVATWYACAVSKQHNPNTRSKFASKENPCFCGFNHENRIPLSKERTNSGSSRNKATQDWEKLKGVWNNLLKSPLFNRRKKAAEKVAKSNDTDEEPSRPPVSPLLLQRFLHQQIQHFNAIRPFRSPSMSPNYSPEGKGERFRYDEGWLRERERRGSSMSPPLQPRHADQFARHSSRNYRVSPSPTWLVRSKSSAERPEIFQPNPDSFNHTYLSRMNEPYPLEMQELNHHWRLDSHRNCRQLNMSDNPWRTDEPLDLRIGQVDARRDDNIYKHFDKLISKMEDRSNENCLNSRLGEQCSNPQMEEGFNRRINGCANLRKEGQTERQREEPLFIRNEQFNPMRQDHLEDQITQRMADLYNMRLSEHSKAKLEEQLDHVRAGRTPVSPCVGNSPEPPPRINKRVSPLLARRIAYNNSRIARLHHSPNLPRRYNYPYQYGDTSNPPVLRSSSLPCSPILSTRNYTNDLRNFSNSHKYTP